MLPSNSRARAAGRRHPTPHPRITGSMRDYPHRPRPARECEYLFLSANLRLSKNNYFRGSLFGSHLPESRRGWYFPGMSELLAARRAMDLIRKLGPGKTANYVAEILNQYSVPTVLDRGDPWTADRVRRLARRHGVKLAD